MFIFLRYWRHTLNVKYFECLTLFTWTFFSPDVLCKVVLNNASVLHNLNFYVNYIAYTMQSLSHCEMITDEGIRHLGGGGCATEALTVLELDNCPLISDTALDHLMGCQSLQRIELYDCQLITRAGIRRLKASISIELYMKLLLYTKFDKCKNQQIKGKL